MKFKLPKFKDYVGQEVRYYSLKADGHMQYVMVDGHGVIRAESKNFKDTTAKLLSVTHIKHELQCLPLNSVVMGECHCPGEHSTEIPHMLCTGDERLRFSVFAAPLLEGIDLIDYDLPVVMAIVKHLGLDCVPVSKVIQGFNCTFRAQLLRQAVTQKIEGWVLKNHHMSEWYKLKPVKTVDAFVVGVTESDSDTYKGYMKAVLLCVWDKDGNLHDLGKCGGGFTKEFKLSMPYALTKYKLINKVCEVTYQSITKNKKLQFPRFVRWRTDKNPIDCTTEQLL